MVPMVPMVLMGSMVPMVPMVLMGSMVLMVPMVQKRVKPITNA